MKKIVEFMIAAAIVFAGIAVAAPGVFAAKCLTADAGQDKEIDSRDSIRLDGSVKGNYNSVFWSCTGGGLVGANELRPTFRIMPYDYDYSFDSEKTYTCTMTAHGGCGSDSDTMTITVSPGGLSKMKVALIARPKSECAPANNVDMIATLSDYGVRDRDYTYYFDCHNDGKWDKIITVDETSYTASDLCDYPAIGSYTARVRVEGGSRAAADTEIVKSVDCRDEGNRYLDDGRRYFNGRVSITKNVRNLSAGTGYLGAVAANPGDVVSYRLVIAGVSGSASNIMVSDAIPAGITGVRNLKINGLPAAGNLVLGINIGSLSAGQVKIITYDATIAGAANFNYGQEIIMNTSTVTVGGESANSRAAVQVYRSAVNGATMVPTGVGGNMFAGLIIALAGMALSLAWVFRYRISGFIGNYPRRFLSEK